MNEQFEVFTVIFSAFVVPMSITIWWLQDVHRQQKEEIERLNIERDGEPLIDMGEDYDEG